MVNSEISVNEMLKVICAKKSLNPEQYYIRIYTSDIKFEDIGNTMIPLTTFANIDHVELTDRLSTLFSYLDTFPVLMY